MVQFERVRELLDRPLVIGGISTLFLVWVANLFLLDTTTTETGWPLMIGLTVLLVVLVVGLRQAFSKSGGKDAKTDTYPWNNR